MVDQPETSAVLTGALSTLLNITAAGRVNAAWSTSIASYTVRVKITIDSVVVVDETSPSIAGNEHAYLGANGKWFDTNSTLEGAAAHLINMPFKTALIIEALSANGATIKVRHSIS